MNSQLDSNGVAIYSLRMMDNLEPGEVICMNDFIGQIISIQFTGVIHCVETGKSIKKTFGEGLSYDAWLKSPLACPSIVHPELSRIHEGIALRDFQWEMDHHMQPHVVYLSKTSHVKVGVTRSTNKPSRWIDQGASEAIVIANTPYRQLAGLIEVELKNHMSDKTNWQLMLKGGKNDDQRMHEIKDEVLHWLPEEFESFVSDDDSITHISYPGERTFDKITSIKLDKVSETKGRLAMIKGQYLVFENGHALNIRSHAGYRIKITGEGLLPG
ncbi:MAG: DUF2797 domain-containing protein [Flavobacteriales bacterium]